MKKSKTICAVMVISMLFTVMMAVTPAAYGAPGDLLGTVSLPGNGTCNVGGTFNCTYYMAIQSDSCSGSTMGIFLPPAGGNGNATLVSTKSIVDAGGSAVTISGLAWDPGRGKVWGAYSSSVWLIDIGDPTVSGNALATFQFLTTDEGPSGGLIDGLAYDPSDDTVYWSKDATCCVWQFSPTGSLLNTITPTDANGIADGRVSGVAIGSGNTLYIGRDGDAEIRLVDKTTGAFIAQFATTSGRVEDLSCDAVTYAPKEAILSKDAYSGLYEAFEVEPGTCPCIGDETVPIDIDIKPASCPNPLRAKSRGKGVIPVAILGSDELDVMDIDITTITLEGVSPIRSAFEDVSTPFEGEECECTTEQGDGILDLTLKFDKREILDALEDAFGDLGELDHKTEISLYLTAMLIDEEVTLEGTDCVRILNRRKRK